MSTVNIVNPKSLGVDYRTDFLGNFYRYKVTKTVALSGYLLDLVALSGVTNILDNLEGVLASYIGDFMEVSVNGISLGTGLLSNLDFSSGNDVRKKEYSATFVFYEDGDLTGKLPAGVSADVFKYIQSVNEDFVTDHQVSDIKQCTHSISVKILDNPTNDGIAAAKILASQLLGAESFGALSVLWGNPTVTGANIFYSETYNKITNDCSFSKRYVLDPTYSNAFTKKTSHVVNAQTSGVTTVQEKVEYKTKKESFQLALTQLNSDIGGAYSRCSDVYDAYKDSEDPALSTSFFEKKIAKSENEGICSYEVTFSNDIFYRADSFWSYTHDITVNDNGITSVSERGEIIGLDIVGEEKKQKSANDFWTNTVRGGIEERLSDFYTSVKDLTKTGIPDSSCATTLYLESRSVTKNNRSGKVTYECAYSNDPARNTGDDNFKKIVKTCVSQAGEKIRLSSNILVANYKEVKQWSANNKESQMESTIVLFGANGVSFDDYVAKANTLSADFCLGDVATSASFEFDQRSNKFTASVQSVILDCR